MCEMSWPFKPKVSEVLTTYHHHRGPFARTPRPGTEWARSQWGGSGAGPLCATFAHSSLFSRTFSDMRERFPFSPLRH